MSKVFNTTAVCMSEEHYMVNIDKRLKDIKKLVDERKYFTINRARQYGKTTTLMALEQYLKNDYYVVLMDFQTFDAALFKDGNVFSLAFADSFINLFRRNKPLMSDNLRAVIEDMKRRVDGYSQHFTMKKLFENLSDICFESDKPIVLMIDEVDSATNNQVFLDFLSQLRAYYIKRATQPTFWSVILAGVYDVKNLRIKIRAEEEHKVNSPWNIAADFEIDMSFSKDEIAGMLREYESDYHTGMDIDEMAGLIHDHTSGYPFLVSRLCKLIDEKVNLVMGSKSEAWTLDGFMEADRILTSEKNTLFESMIGKIINYPSLNSILQNKIFKGETVSYNASTQEIDLAAMFGIIKNEGGVVVPANKVFAKVLADYYLSQDEIKSIDIYKASLRDKNQFVENGKLNMKRILERFMESFTDLYEHKGKKFIEEEGKKYFLLYLRPIINGIGHYSLEAVTGNNTRTDVIVYYNRDLFIIETKIWHGSKANKEAEKQLLGYMKSYHQDIGYLLTFNFNKNKKQESREVKIEGKTLIEVIV
ncbi:MAG: AAA-like domain-containing protein [Lachnospiraceae bacterium]